MVYVVTLDFPVLFSQPRVGKNQQLFVLYKFRTLSTADKPLKDRQFTFGRWLRFLSLDELPQLINVIRGDMSFIGPRPLPAEYLPLFNEQQNKRHAVLPGITGLAQINGRNSLSWDQKFQYDVQYVTKMSFILDISIVIRTMMLLLSFKRDVSLDEKPFRGS